jgi:hypothetical protein
VQQAVGAESSPPGRTAEPRASPTIRNKNGVKGGRTEGEPGRSEEREVMAIARVK